MTTKRSKPKPRTETVISAEPPLIGSDALRQRPLSPEPAAAIPGAFVRSPTWHPFLYRKRIDRVDGKAKPGDMVAVYGPNDQILGYGLYNPRSEISVRMLFYGSDLPSDNTWQTRLNDAVDLRCNILRLDRETDAYRVIFAEADGLSGLVVDRFADVLSAEVYSLGMYQRAEAIMTRLARQFNSKATLVRPSPQFLSQEGYQPPEIVSSELHYEVVIQEYGTRFRVRFAGGHKTGFFCDQRENRRRLADFCNDRTVLDLCCYTGGFSVQAKALGKAREVTGVDLDEEPLKLAQENANLNQARCRFVQADAFQYMREMQAQGRQYDVVILDPPKLIRSRMELEEGTKKHLDLNRLAMRLVKPGGLMLSCCCSGLLHEAEFVELLRKSAYQSGELLAEATETTRARHSARPMQFLYRTGPAADHPVAAHVPETEYLKAVWMRLG
jgi:23S rRNA (cytosine1962-C5)-methyltransferase